MPKVLRPPKRRIKKKRVKMVPPKRKRRDDGERKQEREPDGYDSAEAGKKLQSVARGFRLSFSDLGRQRKLSDRHFADASKAVNADTEQLQLSKLLYAKHPAMKDLNAVKSQIATLFISETNYYSEKGVRLFVTKGETEEERLQETNLFIARINEAIEGHTRAVAKLKEAWPEILAASKEKLRDVFDEHDYPTMEDLDDTLRVELQPENLELPDYFKQIDPAEYRRQVAILERKFAEAAELQATHFAKFFSSAIDQMVSSIKGYTDGKQSRFRNSVVTKCFDAVDEFKKKCSRFGILNGTELERELGRLEKLLGGSEGRDTLPDDLRDDVAMRAEFLEKANSIRDAVKSLESPAKRRSLIRE